jgi:HAD superfamily hydrolase (TIGR01484 family)
MNAATVNGIQPVSTITNEFCKNLKIVFTDIDDTLTTDGVIPASSYSAIWKLYKNGISVVPITGRSAGWCDYIARMWPVAGVIGENGAFYYSYNRKTKKIIRKYTISKYLQKEYRRKIEKLKKRVLLEVPNSAIASDQDFRLFDLAIDIKENIKPLSQNELDKIFDICASEGAINKLSSIHVNCWFGNYNKLTCLQAFLSDTEGKTLEEMQDFIIFAGDSPNDEPLFRELQYSIGVENISDFLDQMSYFPTFITNNKGGEGFQEAVSCILAKKNSH